MTKFQLLLSCLIIFTINCAGQKKAVTENGDEIIIYDNGTWKYSKDFNPDDSNVIKTNPVPFVKPKTATFLLKAKNANVGFWIDSKKWTFGKGETNQGADFELALKGQSLQGVIISEAAEIPLESYVEVALINGRNSAPDLRIVDKEYRTVNGLKVLHLRMEGTQVGVKFSYYSYYFSNETSTVQFLVASYSTSMKKYAKEIDDLLNGIVELKTDAQIPDQSINIDKASDTTSQGSMSAYNNCKQFFEGNWTYTTDGKKVDVERTFNKTIEHTDNGKYTYEYATKWIDDCHYELIFKKTSNSTYKLEKPGEIITVEILEINKNMMRYVGTYRGVNIKGEMRRR